MLIVEAAAMAAARTAAAETVKRYVTGRSRHDSDVKEVEAGIEKAIASHIVYVNTLSSRVHIFGMTQPKDTDSSTISIDLSDLPRRLRSGEATGNRLTEGALIDSPSSYAILGDPGAGKTTMIKRLARRLILTAPESDADIWSFPILIECREHDWTSVSLEQVLQSTVGVPRKLPEAIRSSIKPWNLAIAAIDAAPAVVFIDGLDEVAQSGRLRLETAIERLANKLGHAKVVVSCRSGDYRHIEGFHLVELCPLDDSQINHVAERWLDDGASFLRALRGTPVADLASRPLFLAQLMIVYKNSGGAIPDQPASLYRRIIRLLLQDWDEHRRIARPSAYARFQVDDKLEFLSSLSYELTVERKSLRFTNGDLVAVYRQIADKFDLPAGEANTVAQEVETHTGIIVATGDRFEFSHLSLQEFLCAWYMVREPLRDKISQYLREYPAPVAVAVALSSDPSEWLATVTLRPGVLDDCEQVRSFVYRLGKERPRFTFSINLGVAMLKLMSKTQRSDTFVFRDLAAQATVVSSIVAALRLYRYVRTESGIRILAEPGGQATTSRFQAGEIDSGLFDMMTSARTGRVCSSSLEA